MDPAILNTIRTRPRFVYESNLKKAEYMELLKAYFDKKNKKINGYITDEISYFCIKSEKKNLWNPCLQLKVEDDPYDHKTYVRGMFGPKPEIWTLFSFMYFGSIVLGLLSLFFYLASLSFDASPLLLIIGMTFLLFSVSLFIISKTGQIATRDQMRLLKTFILMVIKDDYTKSHRLSKQF